MKLSCVMGQKSLGISMIAKNAEATLARCLESVLPLADEIVIGDTGSTDSTMSIAQRYGARVIEIPWERDFARARNRGRPLAVEVARVRLSVGSPSADNFLLAAKLCSLSGRAGEGHAIVTMGLARYPEDAGLRSALVEGNEHPSASA